MVQSSPGAVETLGLMYESNLLDPSKVGWAQRLHIWPFHGWVAGSTSAEICGNCHHSPQGGSLKPHVA